MEHTTSMTASDADRSNRLVHRLAARELTVDELAEIGGGMRPSGIRCGTVSCSACTCDDSDM